MSLYIRVLNNFYTHRKTLRLRALIGDAAFWIPPRLWAYAAENQPDGCFKDYSADEMALLVGYSSNAQVMLQALLQAGFLDDDPLRIHDWDEHNAYHSAFAHRAKKAATARWNKFRENEKTVPDKKGKDRIGDKHCFKHTEADPAGVASASPTPPPDSSSFDPPTETGVSNHPPLPAVVDYFSKLKGCDFRRTEVEQAFRTFEAAKDRDGNWWWGKRMVGDWRAAMESRVHDQRKSGRNGKEPTTAKEAVARTMREMERLTREGVRL